MIVLYPCYWMLPLLACFSLLSHGNDTRTEGGAYLVPRATAAPKIDGVLDDSLWDAAAWKLIDKPILGTRPSPADFSGRYKLLWDTRYVYVLAEIVDDHLSDTHANPLERYWEDDALEIFIDEDASGGDHQFNYNAFAYHIALDNQAVDIGPFLSDKDRTNNVRVYPEHITSRWRRSVEAPHAVIWEVAISVFGDDYQDVYKAGETVATPKRLYAGKKMGFMLAYCDSDTSGVREHFMGDIEIAPVNGDRNRGYIDASVFGIIVLQPRRVQ